jgi:hypothetical protein
VRDFFRPRPARTGRIRATRQVKLSAAHVEVAENAMGEHVARADRGVADTEPGISYDFRGEDERVIERVRVSAYQDLLTPHVPRTWYICIP